MRLQFNGKGKIGREIAHRTDFNTRAEFTVLRDLGRYYDLLDRERRNIALTRDEAELVCLAVGGSDLDLSVVRPLWSWVCDFVDVMGDELKSEMSEELKVDFRKLRPKLRRLTDAQTLAVLDAADSYMLGRRWIATGRKDIEASGLVREPAKSRRSRRTRSPRRRQP
jgi:hypothetical protein